MPKETTYLPLDSALGTISFFALLAYPKDWKQRDAFVKTGKAFVCHKALPRKQWPDWVRDYSTQQIFDSGRLTMGFRLIGKRRLPAAKILFNLTAQQTNAAGRVRKELGGIGTLEEAKRFFTPKIWRLDNNTTHRVWAESKPVLHLAYALQKIYIRNDKGEPPNLWKMMLESQWLPDVLESAETTRRIIIMNPAIRITDADTIQVLPKN